MFEVLTTVPLSEDMPTGSYNSGDHEQAAIGPQRGTPVRLLSVPPQVLIVPLPFANKPHPTLKSESWLRTGRPGLCIGPHEEEAP